MSAVAGVEELPQCDIGRGSVGSGYVSRGWWQTDVSAKVSGVEWFMQKFEALPAGNF